jgi:hypothetical protein
MGIRSHCDSFSISDCSKIGVAIRPPSASFLFYRSPYPEAISELRGLQAKCAAKGVAALTGPRTRPRAALVRARAGAYIFPRDGRRVLLCIYGEPVRNQVSDGPQARLLRGAAFAECGGGVHAAAEGVRQYGSAGLGAEHLRSTGLSSGEVRSAGFRSGLQGRRGDANRRMAPTVRGGPSQARSRSADKPADRWRTDGCA